MLELRPLQLSDEASFRAATEEMRREQIPWDFTFGWGKEESFEEYVRRHERWARGEGLPAGFVPSGFYVGVVDGEVVGRVSIRFQLNDMLAKVGGHIGYGVRPSQRRKGYATQMLRLALPIALRHGIERVLLTCNLDNLGSCKVIERCGGVFESIADYPELGSPKRRYWIATVPQVTLSPASADDAELIYSIKHAAYHEHAVRAYGRWDEEFQRRFTREQISNIRLISVQERIVGWVSVRRETDHHEIVDLHIAPNFQRRGIGGTVVESVIAEAGRIPVSLYVLKTNPARSLYERLGFAVSGETSTHTIMRRSERNAASQSLV